jgi:hypothetical protein
MPLSQQSEVANAAAMMLFMIEGSGPPALAARRLTATQQRTVLLLLAYVIGSSIALSQAASPSRGSSRLAIAVDKTLTQGRDAILPPHISHLLGISPDEREVPVKQFAQIGEVVKGFEISVAKHEDIVIFLENRSNKESTFYLTSPSGKVKKVVSVKAGVGYDRPPTAKEKSAFESEKQYWLDLLVPKPPK